MATLEDSAKRDKEVDTQKIVAAATENSLTVGALHVGAPAKLVWVLGYRKFAI